MEQVTRQTVVITGATKGIGRAIALQLAERNYHVVLNYSSDERSAQETLDACRQINPHVLLIKANVAQKSQVEMLFQESFRTFHSIDVLINNAGVNIDKPLHEVTEEDWDRVVDVNMKGVFLCAQIASATMLQQEHGGIILNIGASTGIRGRINGIQYCASKAGVLVMTKCLAMELAPKVRVNCLIPGLIQTEETKQRLHLDDPEHPRLQEVPLKRFGEPSDVADVVRFLLSPEARYITGQKIMVDGGQFMW